MQRREIEVLNNNFNSQYMTIIIKTIKNWYAVRQMRNDKLMPILDSLFLSLKKKCVYASLTRLQIKYFFSKKQGTI